MALYRTVSEKEATGKDCQSRIVVEDKDHPRDCQADDHMDKFSRQRLHRGSLVKRTIKN